MNNAKKLTMMYAMAMACSNGLGFGSSTVFANKSTEQIIQERRSKGIKPSRVEKPVPEWAGKKKISRKKRKQNANGKSSK